MSASAQNGAIRAVFDGNISVVKVTSSGQVPVPHKIIPPSALTCYITHVISLTQFSVLCKNA